MKTAKRNLQMIYCGENNDNNNQWSWMFLVETGGLNAGLPEGYDEK